MTSQKGNVPYQAISDDQKELLNKEILMAYISRSCDLLKERNCQNKNRNHVTWSHYFNSWIKSGYIISKKLGQLMEEGSSWGGDGVPWPGEDGGCDGGLEGRSWDKDRGGNTR